MRHFVTLLVLVLSLPSLAQEASASDSRPQAGAEALPDWSFGFGYGVGLGGISSTTYLVGGSIFVTPPRVEGTVERRFGAKSWWVLGLGASYSATQRTPEVPLPLEDGSLETRVGSAALSLGVRHWLTDRSAPVILSVAGLVDASYLRAIVPAPTLVNGALLQTNASLWSGGFGVSGQVAVERFLTEALSLRLRLQVLRLGYAFGRQRSPATSERLSSFNLELPLSPTLELRLYF